MSSLQVSMTCWTSPPQGPHVPQPGWENHEELPQPAAPHSALANWGALPAPMSTARDSVPGQEARVRRGFSDPEAKCPDRFGSQVSHPV